MKKLIFALSVLVLSAQAQARSMKAFVSSELTQISVQPGSFLAQHNPIGGELFMGLFDHSMTLQLNLPGTCPKDAMCIWAGPAPLRYTFQAKEVMKGHCGETITVSEIQPIEAGGPLATLMVTDFRTITCKILLPRERMTSVNLTIHGFIVENHQMTGGPLQ
ncbi:MAG: hypothetical protein AB7F86_04545 [Bdellovibrionales bacterium]